MLEIVANVADGREEGQVSVRVDDNLQVLCHYPAEIHPDLVRDILALRRNGE